MNHLHEAKSRIICGDSFFKAMVTILGCAILNGDIRGDQALIHGLHLMYIRLLTIVAVCRSFRLSPTYFSITPSLMHMNKLDDSCVFYLSSVQRTKRSVIRLGCSDGRLYIPFSSQSSLLKEHILVI